MSSLQAFVLFSSRGSVVYWKIIEFGVKRLGWYPGSATYRVKSVDVCASVFFSVKQGILMIPWGFPGGSVVKNLPANAGDAGGCGFEPWVGKIPRRMKWQCTPIFLPGNFHGQRSLVG